MKLRFKNIIKKYARKGCNHSVGRAHGIGWEKDYCSATCAFQDR